MDVLFRGFALLLVCNAEFIFLDHLSESFVSVLGMHDSGPASVDWSWTFCGWPILQNNVTFKYKLNHSENVLTSSFLSSSRSLKAPADGNRFRLSRKLWWWRLWNFNEFLSSCENSLREKGKIFGAFYLYLSASRAIFINLCINIIATNLLGLLFLLFQVNFILASFSWLAVNSVLVM